MENFLWAVDSDRVLKLSFLPRNEEEGLELKECSFTPPTPNPVLVPTVAIENLQHKTDWGLRLMSDGRGNHQGCWSFFLLYEILFSVFVKVFMLSVMIFYKIIVL